MAQQGKSNELVSIQELVVSSAYEIAALVFLGVAQIVLMLIKK